MKKPSYIPLLCLILVIVPTYCVVSTIETDQQPVSFLQVSSHPTNLIQLGAGNKKSVGQSFAEFIFGTILIAFSFPILWNNERKQVRIAALIQKARKQCVDINCNEPVDELNFKLVYASGETKNEQPIKDPDFEVEVENSVKLIRVVEMYQWVEMKRNGNGNDNNRGGRGRRGHHHDQGGPRFEYVKEWRDHHVNSSFFEESYGHENPHDMPYLDKNTVGDKVKFGGFMLAETQKNLLTNKIPLTYTKETVDKAQEATGTLLKSLNYENLKAEGNCLMARKGGQVRAGTDIGDLRITFYRVPCGPTSIIAQQIKDRENFTYRKWNPKKVDAFVGENNDPEEETVCLLCACCACANCVDKCFQNVFPEVIEIVKDQPISREDIFKDQELSNQTSTSIFRVIGFLFLFFGIYLLFSPIITLMSWIPLVGWMLSAGVSFVAWIIALIVGLLLTFLTIAIAWIYYRPFFGIILLACVGVLVGLLCTSG